jgi:hypothetical protein
VQKGEDTDSAGKRQEHLIYLSYRGHIRCQNVLARRGARGIHGEKKLQYVVETRQESDRGDQRLTELHGNERQREKEDAGNDERSRDIAQQRGSPASV